MPTQRVYICPTHPEKPYSSWRKFRGHWSTKHKGEECPPREEFLQEVEREEFLEQKKEFKEAGGFPPEETTYGKDIPLVGVDGLPEDPIQRLATILDVHGVDKSARDNLLAIFQLHPNYKDNPVNLHYLLTAKLPRRLHSSIPMMISEFTAQEASYPEGIPFGMIQPGMGGGGMPPYMMGGGYQSYYPPFYSPPMGGYRHPSSGRGEVEEEPRARGREHNPIQDAVALLGTIMELKEKLIPEGGGTNQQVQEIFEGFRSTIEEVTKGSKDQQDKLLERLEKMEEGHRGAIEGIKGQLHEAEKARLEDRISSLEEAKDDERTEGLGSLLKEAGAGVGTQVEGLRQSVTQGVDKLGILAEKIVSVEGSPKVPTGKPKEERVNIKRTIGEATELMKAEGEVEALAKELEILT